MLEGASNFRDVGGHRTRDGNKVRTGLLYRSNGLAGLTDGDLQRLAELGVRHIHDLRRDEEEELMPTRLAPQNAPRVVRYAIGPDRDKSELYDALVSQVATRENIRDIMVRIYEGFVTDFTPHFGQVMRNISDHIGEPGVFHCTAGKDRTGFVAALILHINGVDDDTIMADYLKTNELWKRELSPSSALVTGDDNALAALSADPDYLVAAMDTAVKQYGSLDAYIEKGLQLTPKLQDKLRHQLTESIG